MLTRQRIRQWINCSACGPHANKRTFVLEKIFLHIGLEKTGTTTLQFTMALNQRLLRNYGYFFPTTLEGSTSNHIGLALCAASPEAASDLGQYAGLTNRAAYSAFLERYPKQMARELIRSGCHTAILSNEHCSSRLTTIAEIAKLYRIVASVAPQIRVVIYLRRQDELVASHYSNFVRSGATREFEFPQNIGWLDYLNLLEMWADVFGRENLSIRIFEREQMKGGDLLADFCSTIGFSRYDELPRLEDQNRGLDVYTLEFLRRFNACAPSCSTSARRSRGDIEDALAAISTRDSLRPSGEAAAAFLDQFAASNAEVARRFLNREDGILFRSGPLRDQPARLPTLDIDKLMAIAVALWQWQETRWRRWARQHHSGFRQKLQ
jgi:hypothetical protein